MQGVFFAVAASLIPKDVSVTLQARLPGGLSPEDWQLVTEIMSAVKTAIPDAGNQQPGAVLEHTLAALRAYDATIVSTTQVRHMNLIDDKSES
jgi:hypothetical protein